jgi:hypothetical protein
MEVCGQIHAWSWVMGNGYWKTTVLFIFPLQMLRQLKLQVSLVADGMNSDSNT